MREKFPEIYFQNMVKLALVHRVDIGQPKEFDKPRTPAPFSADTLFKLSESYSRTSCAGQAS